MCVRALAMDNNTVLIISNIISAALFILSEIIPFLNPPQKGVCQQMLQVGGAVVTSLGSLSASKSGDNHEL